jgi:hypothetical protein
MNISDLSGRNLGLSSDEINRLMEALSPELLGMAVMVAAYNSKRLSTVFSV